MTTPPTVRDARADDLDALLVLIHSAYRGQASRAGWTTEADLLDGGRTDADMLGAELADPATTLLVAQEADDGPLVACCAVTTTDDVAVASFGTFAVLPERQGSGLGRRMLAEAEEYAAGRGVNRMEMSVIRQRAELIAWYVRRGYEVTDRTKPFPYGNERYGVPRRDDLEFLVLVKTLT